MSSSYVSKASPLYATESSAAMDVIRKIEKEGVKVLKNVKETGRVLGKGSYGTVVELTIKGAGQFAGKKIHEVLIVNNDATLMAKECKVMSALEHPNIVKFCGVCRLSSTTIPVLVMELMHQSLEDAIESKTTHLEYETALSILVDVANGLAYLHCYTPRVYHRDLTARNVLLDQDMKAKITDFGNSKIIDPAKVGSTMTQVPGTSVYMPPEAFGAKSKYSDRLDIFSFGHLALYAMILQFPMKLSPSTYCNSEGNLVATSEVERRREYMNMLSVILPTPDHFMYQLIEQCLHNDPTKRPSAVELLYWLQEISRVEHKDFEESLDVADSEDVRMEKVTTALKQMQAYINKRPAEDVEEYEKRPLVKFKNKMGLIEKRSERMLIRGWKAYQFTVDYNSGTFHYSRLNPFGPSTVLQLENITEVKELDPEDSTFPFEVYFKGSNLPWILRTYSEAERGDWKEALESYSSKMDIGVISSPQMKKLQAEDGEKNTLQDPEQTQEEAHKSFSPTKGDQYSAPSHALKANKGTLTDEAEDVTTEYDLENVYVDLPTPTSSLQLPTMKVIPPSPRLWRMGNKTGKETTMKVESPPGKSSVQAEFPIPPHHKKSAKVKQPPPPVKTKPKKGLHVPQKDDSDLHLYEQVDWATPAERKEALQLWAPSTMKTSPSCPELVVVGTKGEETVYEDTNKIDGHKPPSGLSSHHAAERKVIHNLQDSEADEDVYVDLPPTMAEPPAVAVTPPSPRPQRSTGPSQVLRYTPMKAEERPVLAELKAEKYRPHIQSHTKELPTITQKASPSFHSKLTRVKSAPSDSTTEDDLCSHLYEPVRPMNLSIPPKEAPRNVTPLDLPPHPLDDNSPSRKSSNVAPPIKPRLPRPLSPVFPQHKTRSPMEASTPSPKPRTRRLPQPPPPVAQSPVSPTTSTELHKLLQSVSSTDEGIYEVIDTEPVVAPMSLPLQGQPPLPPRRAKKFTPGARESQETCSIVEDLHKEEDTCADLEDLQRKALSISLSSISGMRKIGEGQFGEVYGAKMGKTTVALKIVSRFSSQKVTDQFENEMSIMSQVCHPNIVKVHGILREGPYSPALVMEFLPHGDLKNFLTEEKQSTEFLIKCMSDVAMGMHYLCERGLIHRDLAARNVLLDENKTCKVSDFGLLREVPKDKNVYVAQADSLCPLRWMAPESISDAIFTPASDIWSYGILQWEMFFPDKNPYHDMDNIRIVAKVASGYRLPLPEGCPELVGKIMTACWQKDPGKRPTFLLISSLLTRRDRLS